MRNDTVDGSTNVIQKGDRGPIIIAALLAFTLCCAGMTVIGQGRVCEPSDEIHLRVAQYSVESSSNGSYNFSVWVENQDIEEAHSGSLLCLIVFPNDGGGISTSGPDFTVDRFERRLFSVWTPELGPLPQNITFDCRVL